jgi:hypothetical protein
MIAQIDTTTRRKMAINTKPTTMPADGLAVVEDAPTEATGVTGPDGLRDVEGLPVEQMVVPVVPIVGLPDTPVVGLPDTPVVGLPVVSVVGLPVVPVVVVFFGSA